MSWANNYIRILQTDMQVQFRPHGNSMVPRIFSGQLCTVAPCEAIELQVHDVVLCKVKGSVYLHLISAIKGKQFQISNNKGHVNGWISANAIYGKLIAVED